MANSKQHLFLIVLASWAVLGLGDDMQCMQKLSPCQPYFKKLDEKIPDTCCKPLKNLLSEDNSCVCGVLNNPLVLMKLGVSEKEAMKLPEACGVKVDKCDLKGKGDLKDAKDLAKSPSSSPSSSPTESSSSSPGSPSAPPANAASRFGTSSFTAFVIAAIIFSAAF